MCGIGGFVSKNYGEKDLKRINENQYHRGPDAQDYFFDKSKGIGLCHTRLSIIDLSASANQPMISCDGRFVLAFNGEIYNYRQLKKELDYPFKTNSDTEVLLAAFAKWGTDMVQRLNGMFAMAIYDKRENATYLVRDRIGIKPLFLFQQNDELIFSSELKSVREFLGRRSSVDHQSINAFLQFGYIPHSLTIYENVRKFPPGCFGIFKDRTFTIKEYWSLDKQIQKKELSNEQEVKNKLHEQLISAVDKRLVSDVPFGTFLSGGIDSSLITSIASKLVGKNLKTFSIGFKNKEKNEAPYARKIAKHLKTDHYEYIVDVNEIKNQLPEIVNNYHEPFADSSAFPTMILSDFAKKEVTMALSGDGGDELFHGYGFYTWANRLAAKRYRFLHPGISTLLRLGNSRFKRASYLFNKTEDISWYQHIFSQEQYCFSASEAIKILDCKTEYILEEKARFERELSPAEKQAINDIRFYLPDDLLTKIDRASMKYSLEVRTPFLDHTIVNYALNISESLKVKNKTKKYLLKEILEEYIPRNLFERPKKGFGIPLNKWLKEDLVELTEYYLSKEMIVKHNIFRWEEVKKIKTKYLNNKNYQFLYKRVWLIIVLNIFLEKVNG